MTFNRIHSVSASNCKVYGERFNVIHLWCTGAAAEDDQYFRLAAWTVEHKVRPRFNITLNDKAGVVTTMACNAVL